MTLSLFIPDFGRRFRSAGQPRLPALERMLARSAHGQPQDPREFLGPRFGLAAEQLAVAPFARLADTGHSDGDYWLRADPVHLAADRDRLVLMAEPFLGVEPPEAARLAAAFNAPYAAEGWRLEVAGTSRWYLRCPRPLSATTHEPDTVAGGSILEFMPAGEDAGLLKQLMNEVQMLFHVAAVNQERESAGRPPINSLWLWGGGVLPPPRPAEHLQVWSAAPLLRGLALWSGLQPQAVPDSWIELDLAAAGILELAADDLEGLDRRWFDPLLESLKRGTVEGLEIFLGGVGVFTLTPRGARRFWRRGIPVPVGAP